MQELLERSRSLSIVLNMRSTKRMRYHPSLVWMFLKYSLEILFLVLPFPLPRANWQLYLANDASVAQIINFPKISHCLRIVILNKPFFRWSFVLTPKRGGFYQVAYKPCDASAIEIHLSTNDEAAVIRILVFAAPHVHHRCIRAISSSLPNLTDSYVTSTYVCNSLGGSSLRFRKNTGDVDFPGNPAAYGLVDAFFFLRDKCPESAFC